MKAENWFSYNKLKLNKHKNHNIIVTSHNNLSNKDNVKLLGITIDDTFQWESLLWQLKKILCLKALLLSYHSLFLWGKSIHSIRTFCIRKKAIRILPGAEYNEYCQPLFKKLRIMTLPCIFIYYTLRSTKWKIDILLNPYDSSNSIKTRFPRMKLQLSMRNSLDLKLCNNLL